MTLGGTRNGLAAVALFATCAASAMLGCDGAGSTGKAPGATRASATQPDSGRPQLGDAGSVTLTREQLLDPEACKDCHPRHYREWRSSMHAYAADDPVFLAMNRRGQEQTQGQLGDFCVRCHAPMAVVDGLTEDGLNLSELDGQYRGVTCYFCHTTVGVNSNHNNGLVLDGRGRAGDTTLYGGITDPKQPSAHRAAYSELMDGSLSDSTRTCGACHDIRTASGVHLERTFIEYKRSLFAGGDGPLTCVSCHMAGRANLPAADDPTVGVPTRTVHEHIWAGVDVPLTPWPNSEALQKAVLCELSNGALVSSMQAFENGRFDVVLETNAGHNQPSGASQDRRLWIEVIAYDEQGKVVFQSGKVDDDEIIDKAPDDPGFDPALRVLRSHIYDGGGEEVHMFWEAEKSEAYPSGFRSDTLPPGTLENPEHHVTVRFQLPDPLPARVEIRGRIRPMGLDVLDTLIESGHLDPKFRSRMPTFPLNGMVVEWRRDRDGFDQVTPPPMGTGGCDYRCAFDPNDPECD
jgi:hypothetical protein